MKFILPIFLVCCIACNSLVVEPIESESVVSGVLFPPNYASLYISELQSAYDTTDVECQPNWDIRILQEGIPYDSLLQESCHRYLGTESVLANKEYTVQGRRGDEHFKSEPIRTVAAPVLESAKISYNESNGYQHLSLQCQPLQYEFVGYKIYNDQRLDTHSWGITENEACFNDEFTLLGIRFVNISCQQSAMKLDLANQNSRREKNLKLVLCQTNDFTQKFGKEIENNSYEEWYDQLFAKLENASSNIETSSYGAIISISCDTIKIDY